MCVFSDLLMSVQFPKKERRLISKERLWGKVRPTKAHIVTFTEPN